MSPFPRWVGPYGVARGKRSGFRFHQGRLGVWVMSASGLREFWTAESSPGAKAIEQLVRMHWGAGRVLFLPDGYVTKPDPQNECTRYLVGRIDGPMTLERPDGSRFDLSPVRHLLPGGPWLGPRTTGIESTIDSTGRLECEWELTLPSGRLKQTCPIWGPDPILAAGLRAARPDQGSARVRVQLGGAVITMQEDDDKDGLGWHPRFVGCIDSAKWGFEPSWVAA